jgi:hypothetical protein
MINAIITLRYNNTVAATKDYIPMDELTEEQKTHIRKTRNKRTPPKKSAKGVPKERLPRSSVDIETGEVMTRHLTDGQEAYCRNRAERFGIAQSYRMAFPDAKYASHSGYMLEQKPHIKQRILMLCKERAHQAKLISPEESLARWNYIYHNALERGDYKGMIEAQKNIDKINGADQSNLRQQLDQKTHFRGEEEEWKETARSLMAIIRPEAIDPTRLPIKIHTDEVVDTSRNEEVTSLDSIKADPPKSDDPFSQEEYDKYYPKRPEAATPLSLEQISNLLKNKNAPKRLSEDN